mgnify:CR=1 FL=1
MQGVDLPNRIDNYDAFLMGLLDRGRLKFTGHTYKGAVETVENLGEDELALFPSRFRVPVEKSNKGIKSLSDLVKIDSQSAMREISGRRDVPNRLTRWFLEENKVWPYNLRKAALENCDVENPPMGVYWVGTDNRPRASTFIRETTGAEMEVMRKEEDFSGEVLDRVPYGNSLRVRVSSRTEKGKVYEYTLSNLPIHRQGDPSQFSDWINIEHNSNDPDSSYRGLEHEQRTHSPLVWSASTVFGFYEAMAFMKKHSKGKQFKINPFGIPYEDMINFIDDLRLRSLIMSLDDEGNRIFSVLNKSEMDKIIGSRTILSGYDQCWYHWGKKDKTYLYGPHKN